MDGVRREENKEQTTNQENEQQILERLKAEVSTWKRNRRREETVPAPERRGNRGRKS